MNEPWKTLLLLTWLHDPADNVEQTKRQVLI